MMDNFKEDIVSPRSNALGNVLYALCWVFIVLFGAYALMMLQVVMVQFSVLTLVTVAMAAAWHERQKRFRMRPRCGQRVPPLSFHEGHREEELVLQPRRQFVLFLLCQGKQETHDRD